MMTKNQYVEKLRQARYDYSDELPEKETHGVTGFKYTSQWFTAISGYCMVGKMKNLLSKETIKFCDKATRIFSKPGFAERLTTREDIEMGDQALDMMLEDCDVEILKRGEL